MDKGAVLFRTQSSTNFTRTIVMTPNEIIEFEDGTIGYFYTPQQLEDLAKQRFNPSEWIRGAGNHAMSGETVGSEGFRHRKGQV